MTRAELIEMLYARFARVRSDWPDIVKMVREQVPPETLLLGYARCGHCKKSHITGEDIVRIAGECSTEHEWEERVQALSLKKFPRACIKRLQGFERELSAHKPS